MLRKTLSPITVATTIVILVCLACASTSRVRDTEPLTESQSYDVEAVAARRVTSDQVVGVLRMSPKHENSFPPILSMRVGYGETASTRAVDVQKQTGDGRIQIVIYGEDIAEKSPEAYSVVKDKLSPGELNGDLLLAFNFDGLISASADSLFLTYGLWEKQNTDQRVEKTYGLKIE